MSWITIVWSINVGACLTLATMYLAVWCRERESFVHLLFSCIAASAALIAAYELQLIRADTPEEYGAILRWRPLSTWVLVLSLVAFTRLYLRAGRSWMALSACGLQTLTVIVNFVFTPNLYYQEITAVRQLPWGGETASIPLGTPSPWSLLNQATLLLLLAFFVDATITVWRRGDRERALIVGGTTTFFGAIVAAQFAFVTLGIIEVPSFASLAYLGIVVALGYQLCNDAARAADLASESQVSEEPFRRVIEAARSATTMLSSAQAAQRFLAHDDVDLDEVRDILNDIVTQDQRAGEVIHRLRLLLRKGEPQAQCDDVDLNEVIRDVVKLMRSDLINRNVTVDTDLAQNLPAVTGDRVQLQQVLLNLMVNGCEAMADHYSSECRLLIASQLQNGAVRVSVTDRGGGIPEKNMEQVFERFFTTKKEGMGLGLSVCRTIIDSHRGKIWATNNAGCGATFHFSLPIVGAGKEAVITTNQCELNKTAAA